MTRTVLSIIVGSLSSAFAQPQPPSNKGAGEILAATLADMRGVDDLVDRSGTDRTTRGTPWFSLFGDPILGSPMHMTSLPRQSQGTVSTKRLLHHAPKAARQACEKAAKRTRNKDYQAAITQLERAIDLDRDFAEAHADLGVVYASSGRYSEAESELRRAIELVPEESIPYSNLAWVLLGMGRSAEAEANARRALRLSPDDASAHMLIGRLLIMTPATLSEGLKHLEYAARFIPEARRLANALKRE